MTEWGTNRRGRQHRKGSKVRSADLCVTINWLVSRDGLRHGGGKLFTSCEWLGSRVANAPGLAPLYRAGYRPSSNYLQGRYQESTFTCWGPRVASQGPSGEPAYRTERLAFYGVDPRSRDLSTANGYRSLAGASYLSEMG